MTKRDTYIKLAANYALFGCVVLVAALAMRFVVRSCIDMKRGVGGVVQLVGLAGFMHAVAILIAFILFGEELFDFERCSIRQWIASSAFVTVCLISGALYTPSRKTWKLLVGICCLLFSVVVCIGVPYKGHAYRGGVLSTNSMIMYTLGAFPALAGILLALVYVSNRTSRDKAYGGPEKVSKHSRVGWTLRLLVIVFALCLLVLLGRGVFTKQTFAVYLTGETTYQPVLGWWVLLIFVAILVTTLTVRRVLGNSVAGNLSAVLGVFLFSLTSMVIAAEQIIARSYYLSYHLGTPELVPSVRWIAVGGLGVFCIVSLIVLSASKSLRRKQAAGGLPVVFRCAVLVLGALYFVSGNYLLKETKFVRAIVSVDRTNGEIEWVCEGLPAPRGQLHRSNTAASPTPVVDDNGVYGYFGSAGLLCSDRRGRNLWTSKEALYETSYGVGISPVLCDGKIIVLSESRIGAYLAAFDAKTGELIWKTTRKDNQLGSGNNRTPIVKEINNRKVVLVWALGEVSGYDLVSGEQVWTHTPKGVGGDLVGSMISDRKRLYLPGIRRVLALAIDKLGTDGDPVVWEQKILGPNCSSAVAVDGLLFMVSDGGNVSCLDAATGVVLWRKKLKGRHFASVVAIGNSAYFCNSKGLTTVVGCEKDYRQIAQNDLGEPTYASFAFSDGQLFIRTENYLYCVREK